MKDRTFYVETSVWGMVPKGQPRIMRQASLRFLKQGSRLAISTVVTEEIDLAPDRIRRQIQRVLDALNCPILKVTEECRLLAQRYHDAGIIPVKKIEDALHVAVATAYDVDVLVSWNHKHIANLRKTEFYREVNLAAGFPHTPQILTPWEVMNG